MAEPISEELKIKGTLFFLYLGQLIDLGVIEDSNEDKDNSTKLTVKGYDIAMDSYEAGHRLTDEDIISFLENTPGVEGEMVENLFDLMKHLQTVGYAEMKQQVARVVEIDKALNDGKEEVSSI